MKSQNQKIWKAIENFNLSEVEEYLAEGGDPNIFGTVKREEKEYQIYALEKTMELCNFEMFKLLLDKGADPDQIVTDEKPILYLAAERFYNCWNQIKPEEANDPRYINYLLEKGANPNAEHERDFVLPEILGGRYSRKEYENSLKLIKLLLEKGANPNIKFSGFNPLSKSYREDDKEIVKLLIRYKANTESFKGTDWGGERYPDLEMFKIFLSSNVIGLKTSRAAPQEFTDWLKINKIVHDALLLPNIQEQKELLQKPDNLKALKKVKTEDLQEFYNFSFEITSLNLGKETSKVGQKLDFKKEVLNTCELHISLDTFITMLSHPDIKFELLEDSPEIFKKLFELRTCLESFCALGMGKEDIISFINQLLEDSSWEEVGKKECTEFCINYVNKFSSSGSEPFLSEVDLLSIGQTSEYNDFCGV